MAVVLVLSTLVIYLTVGTGSGPLLQPVNSALTNLAANIHQPDPLEYGSADYAEFLTISRSRSLISTPTPISPAPDQTFTELQEPDPTGVPEPTPYPKVFDASGVPQEGMPVEAFTVDNTAFYVKVNQANVRQAPNTSSEILARCTMGDKLTRLGFGLDWSSVKTADGETGYVLSNLITSAFVAKPTPTPTLAPTPTPRPKPTATPVPASGSSSLTADQKQAIIDLAKSCIGVRYVYGGMSMKGFDCSGFTSYVYKTLFGITLPRSARDQAHAGKAVSKADIQVGDIICFDWDNGDGVCDHVGLYIGGGQYIHAAHSRGCVLESTLKSTNPVVSIRRIIN